MTAAGFERKIVFIGMNQAIHRLRQIQIAMLVSIALYVLIGEKLAPKMQRDPANTLFHALSLVSIILVGATVVVRRTLVTPSEASLAHRPDDGVEIARWRSGYISVYAMCNALALFGLVLRLMGFTLANVWGFYLGGFLLLLLNSPRTPKRDRGEA